MTSADRLLASLPAIYAERDRAEGGTLRELLRAFEAVLFGAAGVGTPTGYEQRIAALPSLIAPDRGGEGDEAAARATYDATTRDAFVPWLAASWVAFTPFAHFEPARLRRIVSGIVPLYARRGTPAYLTSLLQLCFDEIATVTIREDLSGGLVVGRARLGRSTQLGAARPFVFEVVIGLRGAAEDRPALRRAIRAVVDFAKPAHTCCDLFIDPAAGGSTTGAPIDSSLGSHRHA